MMIKNGNITVNPKRNEYKRESNIIDSDKENRMDNSQTKEININDIKTILNKRNEDKRFLFNFNINNINSLININTEDNFKNCNINFLNQDHKKVYDKKKEDVNKIKIKNNKSTKYNKIKITQKNRNIDFAFKDFHKINSNKIIENNNIINKPIKYKEIKFNGLKNESYSKYKQILTPRNIDNNIKVSESNKELNSLRLINKKIITPSKYFNKDTDNTNILSPKSNINVRIKKKKRITFFIKKKTKKNVNNFSLEDDNIKKEEKSNDDKKEKNNFILLKYSKDHKNNKDKNRGSNIIELIKVKKNENDISIQKEKETKEEIINNINRDNLNKQ